MVDEFVVGAVDEVAETVAPTPERTDPVHTPQVTAPPLRIQPRPAAPRPATAVDPPSSPNARPVARPIAPEVQVVEELTIEARVRQAQPRPVDADRLADWTLAISQAWAARAGGVATATDTPAVTPVATGGLGTPDVQDGVVVYDEVAATPTLGWSYEIKAGDSLWDVSEALWGTADLTPAQVEATWRLLYTWNADRLGADPDTIPTGVVIQIPVDADVAGDLGA